MRPSQLRGTLFDPGITPVWGLVLGSGFGGWLEKLRDVRTVPYKEVKGIDSPTVLGHKGFFAGGHLESVPVAVCSGRLHLYEGFSARQVTSPVGVLVEMGVSSVLLTTAVGAVSGSASAGESMAVVDQINLTGTDPHEGTGRFPDASVLYDPSHLDLLTRNGLNKGILAGVRGPSYETPAEVRALEALGADIVCMSTVLEALALAGTGVRCAAVAHVANRAGIGGTVHDKVVKKVESEAYRAWKAVRELILYRGEGFF
jgi:purine-nucleoside phosphorylase